jgi:hypothetical protein
VVLKVKIFACVAELKKAGVHSQRHGNRPRRPPDQIEDPTAIRSSCSSLPVVNERRQELTLKVDIAGARRVPPKMRQRNKRQRKVR